MASAAVHAAALGAHVSLYHAVPVSCFLPASCSSSKYQAACELRAEEACLFLFPYASQPLATAKARQQPFRRSPAGFNPHADRKSVV